ncbi:hypothetical protein RN607_08950 [Demequina capsici]|uniref:Uncharacterized protein n=1 Tax=Demequina capsici TaxID=3075620 RepID=A0AA96F854_9MICO|nr:MULTISPECIES: hypothetical protein [unclassified Demequina]WNM23450.1 hypothetical protein RN606_08725 [Demequina sp. OYTSA14]WNM26327.1 hypothetical protein RN607_08950 [Demequina sp. PMTSA13]
MISFHDMEGALIPAIVLALVVIVAAGLAEGRGRYLLGVLLGIREREDLKETMLGDDVPREQSDWSLVGRVDSPTREQDGEHVPGLRDVAALKDQLPQLKEHVPSLKELPILHRLRDGHDESALHDAVRR